MKCEHCGKEYAKTDEVVRLIDARLANLEGLVLKTITEDQWYLKFEDIMKETKRLKALSMIGNPHIYSYRTEAELRQIARDMVDGKTVTVTISKMEQETIIKFMGELIAVKNLELADCEVCQFALLDGMSSDGSHCNKRNTFLRSNGPGTPHSIYIDGHWITTSDCKEFKRKV